MGTQTQTLGIAINYTPPGSALDMTLAVVHNPVLLMAVLRNAINEADAHAKYERNRVVACGYRTQRDFLRKLYDELAAKWELATVPPAAITHSVM